MFRQQLASRTHQSNERAVKDVVNATMQTFMEKCRATAEGNPQIVVKVVHFGSHPKDSTTPFTSASSFPTCPILSAFRLRWPRHGFGFTHEEVDP